MSLTNILISWSKSHQYVANGRKEGKGEEERGRKRESVREKGRPKSKKERL